MLFVLYILCWSAAFGTATYYVVQRTALFQRTLAAILRKGLRKLLYTTAADSENLDLVYTDHGTTDLAAFKLEKTWLGQSLKPILRARGDMQG